MKGIRELFALMYLVNNDNRAILETSLGPDRPVSKITEAVKKTNRNHHAQDREQPPRDANQA